MLHIQLGLVIHEDRQREIRENLTHRRLLEDVRNQVRETRREPAARQVTRQERAGVAS